MRLGRRAAGFAALPTLALLSLVHGNPTSPAVAVLTSQGAGALDQPVVSRIITDGRPQPITLPAPHAVTARARPPVVPHPARPAAAPVSTTTRVVPRSTVVADNYPYRADGSGGSDPWGFTKRQCVSYVAWRLAEAGRPLDNARDGWGSALDWDDTARGRGVPVSSRPSVGTVAQWDAGEAGAYWSPGASAADGTFVAGSYGHVAWVTQVYADGSAQVAQYNGTGDRTFSTMRVKAPRYLRL